MDSPANAKPLLAVLPKARDLVFQDKLAQARAMFREAAQGVDPLACDQGILVQLCWTSLACGDTAYLTGLLNALYQGNPPIQVTLEAAPRATGGRSSLLARILPNGSLAFSIPAGAIRPNGLGLLAARFIRSVPLFVECARAGLVTEGAAILNIADAARYASIGYCANIDNVMLIPDPDYLAGRGYESYLRHLEDHPVAWDERLKIAFWRGATTGHADGTEPRWLGLQRVKLCQTVQGAHAHLFDAGISRLQLPKDDPGNDEIRNRGYMRPYTSNLDFQKYRFQIDIDGYTSAWSALFQKLATGSTVLKVASRDGWRQWYYDRLVPWENYVPVDAEMGDLVEKTQWLIDRDDEARRIGAAGRALALSMTYDSQVRAGAETIAAWMRQTAATGGKARQRGPGAAEQTSAGA